MLPMMRAVCEKLGVAHEAPGAEVEELSQVTAVDKLAQEIEEKLPD